MIEVTSQTPNSNKNKLKILRLLLSIAESSGPYNLLSLPSCKKQDITICTYFHTNLRVPKEIKLFNGNNSLYGFLRNLQLALSQENYDIIHAHTPHVAFLFFIAKLIMGKRHKFNTVITLHCTYDNLKFRNKLLLISVFPFFKRIVPCSQSSFESLPTFLKKMSRDRIRVISNGVDIDRIDTAIKKLSKKNDKIFRIIYVGRLIRSKNIISLIRAFKKINDGKSELIFIGEGKERKSIYEECKILGIERRVRLMGEIPRNKAYEYLAISDLFVSTSLREGLPIAVLEAMACYCPVILSNIPAHKEIIGKSNFIPLIPPKDIEKLAREISRFRQMSLSKRLDIAKKCRKLVEEKFSLANMISGYERAYKELKVY